MLEYQSPSMSGRSFEDPQVEDAFSSWGGSIQHLVDEMNWELEQLRNVEVPGQGTISIQQLFDGTAAWAEAMFIPSGAVMGFNGTLPQAYELPGWYVMDGRYTDDLLGKYLRFSAKGEDAGGTGGSNTHSHAAATGAATEGEEIETALGGAHYHRGQDTCATGSQCQLVDCGNQYPVAPYNHTHPNEGVGDVAVPATHSHTMDPAGHAHDIGATFELDAASNEPAYWAGIPIQKI